MSKKIKVLYFIDRMLKGGIQALVVDIARNINKDKFQLDCLLLDDGKKYELEDTLKELNCNVYKLENIWIRTPFDYIRYYKEMSKFFKTKGKEYDIVHLHSSSKNFLVLYLAKKNGIKVRIAHSHNTAFQTKNSTKIFFGNILKHFLIKNSTDFMACSTAAGQWLFGDKVEFSILKNAIDLDKFIYNDEKRKEIRNKYGIKDDEIVCGNVGRITEQKNHKFLIEVFNKVFQNNQKYKLLLIGKGEEEKEKELKELVSKYRITNNVIFAGFQENAYDFFNAMDLFVFPSKFEGLGIVLIEAQANGLNCLVSKNIPEEAKITTNVKSISLDNKEEWMQEILTANKQRKICNKYIERAGYNIKKEIEKLETYYIKRVEDEKK